MPAFRLRLSRRTPRSSLAATPSSSSSDCHFDVVGAMLAPAAAPTTVNAPLVVVTAAGGGVAVCCCWVVGCGGGVVDMGQSVIAGLGFASEERSDHSHKPNDCDYATATVPQLLVVSPPAVSARGDCPQLILRCPPIVSDTAQIATERGHSGTIKPPSPAFEPITCHLVNTGCDGKHCAGLFSPVRLFPIGTFFSRFRQFYRPALTHSHMASRVQRFRDRDLDVRLHHGQLSKSAIVLSAANALSADLDSQPLQKRAKSLLSLQRSDAQEFAARSALHLAPAPSLTGKVVLPRLSSPNWKSQKEKLRALEVISKLESQVEETKSDEQQLLQDFLRMMKRHIPQSANAAEEGREERPRSTQNKINADSVFPKWRDWECPLTISDVESILQQFNIVLDCNIISVFVDHRQQIATRLQSLSRRLALAKEEFANIKPIAPSQSAERSEQERRLEKPSTADIKEMGAVTAGAFVRTKRQRSKRTDSMLANRWLAKHDFLKATEDPGILEVESGSLVDVPAQALEPLRRITPPRVNSMHPLSNEEQKLVAKIRSRVEFLRNPRFPKASLDPLRKFGEKPTHLMRGTLKFAVNGKNGNAASKSPSNSGALISAIPDTITFSDYVPHQTYTSILKITNRTTHSARFRVSFPAPYTTHPFFSVQMISMPLNSDGLVAPGMSSRYKISFRPNSLANFDAMLVVFTELFPEEYSMLSRDLLNPGAHNGPISYTVPILARREPPELTLPDSLNCGPRRAGFYATKKWTFSNIGGAGRFIILPQGCNPEDIDLPKIFEMMRKRDSNIELQDGEEVPMPPARLLAGPFEIFPSFFSLQKGDVGALHVRLAAPVLRQQTVDEIEGSSTANDERMQEELLRIACDNQQILDLPLRASVQEPSVSIFSCEAVGEDGTSHPVDFEKGVLQFGSQNLKAVTTFRLTIENKNRLRLAFKWKIVDILGESSAKKLEETSENSSFYFTPTIGELAPNARVTFQLCFCPLEAREYEVMALLQLPCDDEPLAENQNVLDSIVKLPCAGTGREYKVNASPGFLMIGEEVAVGRKWSSTLQLLNRSISPVSWKWKFDGIDQNLVGVEIKRIPVGDDASPIGREPGLFQVELTGRFPGDVNGSLLCETANGVGPTIRVPIKARVRFRRGSYDFGVPSLDLGLLRLGDSKSVNVVLHSFATVPVRMRLCVQSIGLDAGKTEGVDQRWFMRISPQEFDIAPGEDVSIELTYTPFWYQKFRCVLSAHAVQKKGMVATAEKLALAAAVEIRARVETPLVQMIHAQTSLSCFVGVPFVWTVGLKNLTKLRTAFKWRASGETDPYHISFHPKEGLLDAEETATMSLTLTFLQRGVYENVPIFCEIDGMVENSGILWTQLNAAVQGLRACLCTDANMRNYHVSPYDDLSQVDLSPSPFLSFDFGGDCPLFENRSRTLVVRNLSPIRAPFRVWVENYTGEGIDDTDAGRAIDADEGPEEVKGELLLKRTKREKIGFSSAPGQAWIESIKQVRRTIQKMHKLLREGRGAAFHPNPMHGYLEPWQAVEIVLTSYNNLVGTYKDHFVLEVDHWIRQSIPVVLNVEGVPVKLSGAQLVKSNKSMPYDKLNFGNRLIQLGPKSAEDHNEEVFNYIEDVGASHRINCIAEVVTKTFQVENQSPRTLSLRWGVYLMLTSSDGDSEGPAIDPGDIDPSHRPNSVISKNLQAVVQQENLLRNHPSHSPIVVRFINPSAEGPPDINPDTEFAEGEQSVIQAFKTATFAVSFCPTATGYYNAVLVGSVGYLQPDGTVTINPAGDGICGTNTNDFPTSRQIRLVVKARALEPVLVDESAGKPKLRFRPADNPGADAWNNGNTLAEEGEDCQCVPSSAPNPIAAKWVDNIPVPPVSAPAAMAEPSKVAHLQEQGQIAQNSSPARGASADIRTARAISTFATADSASGAPAGSTTRTSTAPRSLSKPATAHSTTAASVVASRSTVAATPSVLATVRPSARASVSVRASSVRQVTVSAPPPPLPPPVQPSTVSATVTLRNPLDTAVQFRMAVPALRRCSPNSGGGSAAAPMLTTYHIVAVERLTSGATATKAAVATATALGSGRRAPRAARAASVATATSAGEAVPRFELERGLSTRSGAGLEAGVDELEGDAVLELNPGEGLVVTVERRVRPRRRRLFADEDDDEEEVTRQGTGLSFPARGPEASSVAPKASTALLILFTNGSLERIPIVD